MERKAATPTDVQDWVLIGCFIMLIALFAGSQNVPAFHSIVSGVFFRINDLVRGLIGA
jgi:hypothetical protein